MYNGPPLLKEKLPQLPWPTVANHRVPMLDPTHGAPGSPPPPCPPSATARFSPSPVSPPHPACTNTDIHNNRNELWPGLLFQSSFSVGGEEVPLTQQMSYGCSARCCININGNRGWPLGQALCTARGRPAELFLRRRCRCGSLRVRTADCDSTAGCVTIRGITPTPTPTLTPTLTPTVTATRGVPYV